MSNEIKMGFYSDLQKKEKNKFFICKNELGKDFECTLIITDENTILHFKKKYPDLICKGNIEELKEIIEIRGRFKVKCQLY